MTKKELIHILISGATKWNEWRMKHPKVLPELSGANLSGADLKGANLRAVNLGGAKLSGAKLSGADLNRAGLNGADLLCALLGNAKLIDAAVSDANLRAASLIYANLSRANLSRANLSRANLSHADLSHADLSHADLSNADLTGVNLTGADLTGTNLSNTKLEQTDFSGATFGSTALVNMDLRTANGLDLACHIGPSSLGIDTLYNSDGKIPQVFLRGCGVPDDFITFIPSHFGERQSIEFYSCFISYSTKDEDFAKRLYSRMRDEKLRVWFAPEDIKSGKKIHEQIEQAIRIHDKLLLVLSENSLQSEWVMTEIRNAREAEIRNKRRKLFPIRLVDFETIKKWKCFDADSGKDLGVEVREYFIPDFTNWKDHDWFEAVFARLLLDFKAEKLD